jgi:uncharacterized protein DUF6766/Rho termination factor-like protein
MASQEELREKTLEELRDLARGRGISGISQMNKDELVEALAATRGSTSGLGAWIRDRGLGIFFVSLFLTSWIAQLIFEWQTFADEQREHDQRAEFWSADFWETFWQSTLENWQSEFLQLAAFTIAAAYFVMKGSSESPDSGERVEAKLDALLERQGIDPKDVESHLPLKFQKTR